MSYKRQHAQPKPMLLKNSHRLQRRLAILLGLALPTTTLLIMVGFSYIFLPMPWEIWLLMGIGLFLSGMLAAWVTLRTIQQYTFHRTEKLQIGSDLIEYDTTSPAANLVNNRSSTLDFDTNQPGLGRVEQTSGGAKFKPAVMELENKQVQLPENGTGGLTQSAMRYRQLVELSPDGIIIIHHEDKISFVNAAGMKLLGSTAPEYLVDKLITDFVHPDYQTTVSKWIQQTRTGQGVSTIELDLVQLDQTEIYVEIAGTPFIDLNEPGVQLVVHDISKRKQTEAEVTQRNRELTILQAAGIAITSRLDLHYVLDTVSQEMTKLLNIESCAIFEWNQTENTITKMAQYGPQGWWNKKSKVDVYSLANYPLTKSILEEQIPEQMTISQPDIDPAELAYMQTTNAKTLMMLPMIFQRKVLGLVKLEDSRVERTFTFQEISMTKLLASQAASAIDNAKLFEQAQQEISERQQAEAALKEERALLAQRVKERTAELSKTNAELARASRLKDEFLAGMSHELRTPLNAILGSAEILQTEVFGPLNEKQQKYAYNVGESGRHLLSLINDILDLSKVEAGKIELEIRPVSIESICQTSLRLVKQLAHKKKLNVSTEFNNTVTIIQADERRLKQILVNLLSNAIKFTYEGGSIGLEVAEDATKQIVHFTVWDTGIGITQENMKRLFQPFVQLDSSLSRQYAGTGLGLSLVSRMVELHGGGVSVESEAGHGSRFTVSLPYFKPTALTSSDEEPEPKTVDKQKMAITKEPRAKVPLILLVDDNEDNIIMLLDFLQAQHYQITIARSGGEAIERAQDEKPDVILMDIQMPGMDGLEATRRLRANANLATVPVIALTALAMPGDRERCLEAGANEYLSKPVSPTNLVKTIETYLD